MDRYLLFGGQNYYAKGGMHDFIESSNDADYLTDKGQEMTGIDFSIDWFHVYDLETKQCVSKSCVQAYGND